MCCTLDEAVSVLEKTNKQVLSSPVRTVFVYRSNTDSAYSCCVDAISSWSALRTFSSEVL